MIIHPDQYGDIRKVAYKPTFSGYKLTVPPLYEPVTVGEVKSALRLTDDSQDLMLAGSIVAASAVAEVKTGYVYAPRTYIQYLDYWPSYDIQVVAVPLQSVTSIKYLDDAGDQQTLAADQYVVDINHLPGRISRAKNVSWPSLYGQNSQIEITFVAGYPEHTGEAAGEITSGAQESILASDFDTEPERSGVLYLENGSGEYEVVGYAAVHEFSGTYTFIVDDTLQYSYTDGATVIAHSIPHNWKIGILSLCQDMFEHGEASSEIMLYKNRAIQGIFNSGAYQEF